METSKITSYEQLAPQRLEAQLQKSPAVRIRTYLPSCGGRWGVCVESRCLHPLHVVRAEAHTPVCISIAATSRARSSSLAPLQVVPARSS